VESSPAASPTPEELEARKAAELRGAPFLLYRDDKGKEQIVELDETRRALTVGRRVEADIALPWDREVSRLHAQFEFRAGEWTVDDDGWSQNGTFVNEMRLDGRAASRTATSSAAARPRSSSATRATPASR